MSKENFILHDYFNVALSKEQFEKAKDAYLNALNEYKYAITNADSIYDLIENIKRIPSKIGPYQNISVFEALNRIGSDLVLLSGASALFSNKLEGIKPEKIHLKMGTTHGFDFEVFLNDNKIIYGEAFNAAASFCKPKMRQAIHKLIDQNPDTNATEAIVFVNKDVEDIIKKYENKKEMEHPEFRVNRVYCGALN
jgi:hypothetical protein